MQPSSAASTVAVDAIAKALQYGSLGLLALIVIGLGFGLFWAMKFIAKPHLEGLREAFAGLDATLKSLDRHLLVGHVDGEAAADRRHQESLARMATLEATLLAQRAEQMERFDARFDQHEGKELALLTRTMEAALARASGPGVPIAQALLDRPAPDDDPSSTPSHA